MKKKFLIILGSLVFLLLITIVAVPILFKDDIKKALDRALSENLDAKVYYDVDKFSLTLIRNFPDLTVKIGDFGIIGVDTFSEDTLVSVSSLEITVDIMSAITGDQIKVNEIRLDEPSMKVLVDENGNSNYDIFKESAGEPEMEQDNPDETATKEVGGVSVGIEKWSINNGKLVYMDKTMDFYTKLIGLNHEGSGDFTMDIFDLTTTTKIDSASLGFDGVEYVSNKTVQADVTLDMNLPEMLFVFKDNRITINQFAMEAGGFISMPGDDIEMDITFGGKDIDLKSILSLIPGVYQEYLTGVSASGEVNFGGLVKGIFNETSMPRVAANLTVTDGRVAYADFNIPIENINIEANFDYPSADLAMTSFNIDRFSMLVDGESMQAYLKFKNLENYTWEFGFDGNADLEKITKIVPLEGMTLRGKINAKLNSSGQMSDLEAENYEALPTTGSLTIGGFYFQSEELPQGFGISKANMTFDPGKIELNQFEASSGNSDFKVVGGIHNYLGFALSEGLLKGSLTLSSNLLDLNEFIPETDTTQAETTEDTTSLEIIRIPETVDFTFTSNINKIAFSNLEILDFQGKVLIKDGSIILDQNSFNLLDGTFEMTGSYATKGLDNPTYDFGFTISELSISKAFESFETVQKFIPIAEQVAGKFSTEFQVNGSIGDDMMPILDSMNLAALVNIVEATLTGGEFVSQLNSVVSLTSGASSSPAQKSVSLKDVLIKAEIRDGWLFIEPFDLVFNGQEATLSGSSSLTGQLDYMMMVKDIPIGAVGAALNSALSLLTDGQDLISDKINLNIGIGGTYDDVKVKLLGTSQSGSGQSTSASLKQTIASKVSDEKAKLEADLKSRKEEQKQKIISEAQLQANKIRSEGKITAEKVRKEGYLAADKLVADAGSNPIKKRAAQESAKKLRSETDKKAAGIENEANRKSDQLVAEAEAKAAKI